MAVDRIDDDDDSDDANEIANSCSAILSEDHFTQEIATHNEEAKHLKANLMPIAAQTITTFCSKKRSTL